MRFWSPPPPHDKSLDTAAGPWPLFCRVVRPTRGNFGLLRVRRSKRPTKRVGRALWKPVREDTRIRARSVPRTDYRNAVRGGQANTATTIFDPSPKPYGFGIDKIRRLVFTATIAFYFDGLLPADGGRGCNGRNGRERATQIRAVTIIMTISPSGSRETCASFNLWQYDILYRAPLLYLFWRVAGQKTRSRVTRRRSRPVASRVGRRGGRRGEVIFAHFSPDRPPRPQ